MMLYFFNFVQVDRKTFNRIKCSRTESIPKSLIKIVAQSWRIFFVRWHNRLCRLTVRRLFLNLFFIRRLNNPNWKYLDKNHYSALHRSIFYYNRFRFSISTYWRDLKTKQIDSNITASDPNSCCGIKGFERSLRVRHGFVCFQERHNMIAYFIRCCNTIRLLLLSLLIDFSTSLSDSFGTNNVVDYIHIYMGWQIGFLRFHWQIRFEYTSYVKTVYWFWQTV